MDGNLSLKPHGSSKVFQFFYFFIISRCNPSLLYCGGGGGTVSARA
jgi:hypothetical protein